jgi:hypothetical protein
VRARLTVIAAATLVVAALAGCSSSDVEESNKYVAAVNDASTTFTTASERLRMEIAPGEGGNRARFQEFYGAVDEYVHALRDIDAPAAVRSLHERLIATMERFGDELRSAGGKITSRNAGRILDGQEQLAEALAAVTRGINQTTRAINGTLQG